MSKHKLLHFIASFAASFIKIIFSMLPVSSNNSLLISLLSHSKKCFPPSPPMKLFLNSTLTIIDSLYS